MTKPLVFNYGHYEKLRDYANDLIIDNQKLTDDNRKLRKEVEELKLLNDGYKKMLTKSQDTANKLALAGLKLQAEVNSKPNGEWEFREVPIVRGGTSFGFVCSNCGINYWQVDGFNFCPRCGADMRK